MCGALIMKKLMPFFTCYCLSVSLLVALEPVELIKDQLNIYKQIKSLESTMIIYGGTPEDVSAFKTSGKRPASMKPIYKINYWCRNFGSEYRLEVYTANPNKPEAPLETLNRVSVFRNKRLEMFYSSNSEIRIFWEPPNQHVRVIHRLDGMDQVILKPISFLGWDIPIDTDIGQGLALHEIHAPNFIEGQLKKLNARAALDSEDPQKAKLYVPFSSLFYEASGAQRIQVNEHFSIDYTKIKGKWIATLYNGQFFNRIENYEEIPDASAPGKSLLLPRQMTTYDKIFTTEKIILNGEIKNNIFFLDYTLARKIHDYTAGIDVDPDASPEPEK